MLEDLITSKTRVKVLYTFLENPSEMYHVREIVRRVDEEINAVRRELIFLEKKGVLQKEPRANRVYYSFDKSYPFLHDLLRIYLKSKGLAADILKNKVKLGKIKFAMLAGKYVRGFENAKAEEVDLLVVGKVVLPELAVLVRKEEAKRGVEINYTVMQEDEFDFRKKRLDPFISSIIYGPRIMVMGEETALLA